MKLGSKVDTSSWTLPTAQFPPNPVQGTQPTTPAPYTPGPSYGGTYYGYGDVGGGDGRLYNFLPENVASAAQAGKSNPYELLVDDPSKVVTIGSLLQKYKQADGKYMLHPGDTYGVGKNDYKREAQYGTREDLLNLLGLNKDTPDDAKIGITDTYVGEGEAFGGDIYTDIYKDPTKEGTVQSRRMPSNIKGYSASSAPELKGFVQIGNLGPLEDDITKVLGQVYEQFGANTPEQQDAIKKALFKYDPKYGVVANKAFTQDEGLRETIGTRLHAIAEVETPLATVTQQGLKTRRVLRGADQQNVANACQHQGAERVVHHGLVIHRQELLADRQGGWVQTGAGSTGEDDAFTLSHGFVISVSMRSTPCCQYGSCRSKAA